MQIKIMLFTVMVRKALLLLLIIWSFSAGAQTRVLVSIAPQKYLVEAIGGQEVSVEVIVPAGASSHTYEPTPRQIVSMQQGEVWFRLGESFESRLLSSLSHTLIVDQREGISLISGGCGCCHHGAEDPHIWLSPKTLRQLAAQITATLCAQDPAHAEFYQNNGRRLEEELAALDEEIAAILRDAPQTILVSHPAYGYLCRDYGLNQLSIEMEGREPTPRYVTELVLKAKALNIQTVFLQVQHSVKGGKRIAKELGASCVYLDPYAENVLANLKEIAQAFRQ